MWSVEGGVWNKRNHEGTKGTKDKVEEFGQDEQESAAAGERFGAAGAPIELQLSE